MRPCGSCGGRTRNRPMRSGARRQKTVGRFSSRGSQCRVVKKPDGRPRVAPRASPFTARGRLARRRLSNQPVPRSVAGVEVRMVEASDKSMMRAVMRRVHPDLFASHPYEGAQNSESLKVTAAAVLWERGAEVEGLAFSGCTKGRGRAVRAAVGQRQEESSRVEDRGGELTLRHSGAVVNRLGGRQLVVSPPGPQWWTQKARHTADSAQVHAVIGDITGPCCGGLRRVDVQGPGWEAGARHAILCSSEAVSGNSIQSFLKAL